MKVWVQGLTRRVFDQDFQLLVHGHLKRTVLGVLGLVGVNAAVGLSDKRAGDAAAWLAGPVDASADARLRNIVGQKEHDAARDEMAAVFEYSEATEGVYTHSHTQTHTHSAKVMFPTCSWCSRDAAPGL